VSSSLIDAGRTALLVIDMQNDFVEEGVPLEFPEGRRVIPAVQTVLDAARGREPAVIHAAHVHRPRGADVRIHHDLYPTVAAGEAPVAPVDEERGAEIHPDSRRVRASP
jgi:ureidoacrylate peracid hydrolase